MERVEVARLLNKASLEFRDQQEALATVLITEVEARASVFQGEILQGTSAAATEKLADVHTVHIVAERIKIRQKLYALEEELNHYRFMIKYGLDSEL